MENTYYAALPFWTLSPNEYRVKSDVVMEWVRPSRLLFAEICVGYEGYSLLEGGIRAYLERPNKPPLYLGGFYLHKHNPFTMAPNDYHPLRALNRIQPMADAGSRIRIDRDCNNIAWRAFNAWDCELILVVDE